MNGHLNPGALDYGSRPRRRSPRLRAAWVALLTVIALIGGAAAAIADTLIYDGDIVAVGVQTEVDLGTVSPGAMIHQTIRVSLVCDTKRHADPGTTVIVRQGPASSAPPGGSITMPDVVFNIPNTWPNDGSNCPSPAPRLDQTQTVTIVAPTAPGSYTYVLALVREVSAGAPGDVQDPNPSKLTFYLTVQAPANRDPTVTVDHATVTVDEGALATNTGTYSDPDGDPVSLSASVGEVTAGAGTWSWSFQTTDGPAQSQEVTITADDDKGGTGSASFQLIVNNVPPVADFTATSPIDEGSSSTLEFTNAFDPSTADTEAGFHYAFACDGNVNSLPTSYAAAGSSASASCLFQDDGSFIVAGRIFDKDNGYSTYLQTVQVNNVPPAIQALSVTPSAINEGDWVTLTGAIVDPGVQDLITVTVSWGDGNSDLVTLGLGRAFTLTHQYLDDNPSGTPWDIYTITVTAVDDDGGSSDAASTSVTVNNVPPTVGPLTGAPADPIPVNTRITVTAVFTDPGIRDTHTVTVYWDWDTYNPNVTTSPSSTLTLSNGERSFTASYVYSQAGVYTIRAVVADDDGGSGEVIYQYVVVYDPSAGFVTGGGWFWSPKGACQLSWCQDAEGRANFGFVSKYQKGAKVPTGQTEFQFQAGNLNFHSDAYQWLVISGPKAQYKGTGTLNGVSGYGFLLTAWDGQVSGGGGQDKFRIKIWDSYGNVVYDKQMGADDAADPTTVIQGSIVIHTK